MTAVEENTFMLKIFSKVAGGMNGILVRDDGILEGAACWRADGVAVGYSGGDGLVDGEGPAMWGP